MVLIMQGEMIMSARIAIENIAITRAEGPSELCGRTEIVVSFEEADAILRKWAPSVYGNGSDKCDFRIAFEDGFVWSGTYPLGREVGQVDLEGHVRDFFGMLVLDDPARTNFRKWVDPDGIKAAAIREMMAAYDLPSPLTEDTTPAAGPVAR